MNCPCVCTLKKHFVSVLLQTVTQSADSNHTSQFCLEIQMKNSFFSSQSMAGFFTPTDKIFSRCKKKIFLGRVCACLWAFREVYQHTELYMQEQTQIFPAHFFFPFKNTQLLALNMQVDADEAFTVGSSGLKHVSCKKAVCWVFNEQQNRNDLHAALCVRTVWGRAKKTEWGLL